MSREKQIKEMAEITSRDCGNCSECEYVGIKGDGVDCIDYFFANTIYNAGYRKQSEVVREIFAEIEEKSTLLFDGVRNIIVMTETDFEKLKEKHEVQT